MSYPLLWGCLFLLFSGLHTLGLVLYSFGLSAKSGFPRIASSAKADQETSSKAGSWWIGIHAIGAFSTCALFAFIAQNYENSVYPGSFVRVAAYFLDFEHAAKYPGIDHERRMRFLDNQYVAYADPDKWDVKITVEKLYN